MIPKSRARQTLGFGAALLAASLLVAMPDAHAQDVTPSALRTAAVSFGPLPSTSLFKPETFEAMEKMAIEAQWPPPTEGPSWEVVRNEPVVNTRQIDELWHTVQKGEDADRLRAMFRSLNYLKRLNPSVDFSKIEAGTRILVWQRNGDRFSQSYGAAHRGRLRYGEPLPEGENYAILYKHRTFGTYYTVSEVVRVMDAYDEAFPTAHPLMIGDISFRTGRRIHPHRSHQSGRDVDISYPRLKPPPNYERFHYVTRRNLDVEKTLWLVKELIRGGNVEYIFMDRYFQKKLRAEAKRQGAPQEWLDAVFQYPHWNGGEAIVRHSGGHRNHFHIRFKCQETDRRCR